MRAGILGDVSDFTRDCSKQRTSDKESITIANFTSMVKAHLHGKNCPEHYIRASIAYLRVARF
jgi:hypothetical protein